MILYAQVYLSLFWVSGVASKVRNGTLLGYKSSNRSTFSYISITSCKAYMDWATSFKMAEKIWQNLSPLRLQTSDQLRHGAGFEGQITRILVESNIDKNSYLPFPKMSMKISNIDDEFLSTISKKNCENTIVGPVPIRIIFPKMIIPMINIIRSLEHRVLIRKIAVGIIRNITLSHPK